jgi:protein CpxP
LPIDKESFMNAVRKSIAIAVASLALATGAVAASNAAVASPGEGSPWTTSGSHDTRFAERMAKRQAALHDKLGLSPAQEAAWKAFTDKLQATAPVRSEAASSTNMTAPERADRMVAFLQAAEQRATTRAQAVKEFYSALSPEQQKLFDDQFHGRHHRRG